MRDIHEEPWGQRVLRFFDPDRHLIEAGERMSLVARRLRGEGMTLEQMARKMGMPISKVRAIAFGSA